MVSPIDCPASDSSLLTASLTYLELVRPTNSSCVAGEERNSCFCLLERSFLVLSFGDFS